MTGRVSLVRASAVIGLPVVTIDGGEDAAEIKDVVYASSGHRLVGFTLNKRGWFRGKMKSTLEAQNVSGIGPAAIMVPGEDCLTDRGASQDGLASTGVDHDVMGNDVVSSQGSVIGQVIDVILETGSAPSAVGYEVSTTNGSVFIPASAQMGLSAQNLIVPAEAEDFVSNDLAGFGAAVQSFRQRLGAES